MDCIFCSIADKKIPSKIVLENEWVLAFHDIKPQAPVHVVIIPKKHISSLNDSGEGDTGLLGGIQVLIKEIASKLKIDKSGYRVVINTGSDSGQEVAHIHYHILGGRKLNWPPG